MENLYNTVASVRKIKLAPEQILVENNITTNAGEEVVKILSSSADVTLNENCEALKGEVNLSGKIVINVVYITENGELNNQTTVSPFSHKIKNDDIDTSCKFNMSASVVGCEITKVSNNQIKILTTVNIDAVVIKNTEVGYLASGGDFIQVKSEEQSVVYHERKLCEKFEEVLNTSVRGGVKKVLMTNVDLIVKDWSAGLNFVSVDCELYARVLYADMNDPSELQTITISKSVKQEVEADGIDKDSDIDLSSFIVRDGVTVELGEGEETTISINVPIMVCINGYRCNNILTCNDLYSTQSIVEIKNDNFGNSKNCRPEYLESKIEGSVVLSDDAPRVDKYICTTNAKASISNAYVKEGALCIEGVASANVVYLNDELGELLSVEIEIPYVIDKKVDLDEDVLLEPSVYLSDIDVMVKRGRELFFDAKAKAFVNCTKEENHSYIKRAEIIGELGPRDGAIEIYFAKAGESVWDIAKNLKIKPEQILEQNPNISDPLEKDQNIALYFQKERGVEA